MVDTSLPATKVQSYSFAMVCRVKLLMWQLQALALPLTAEMLLRSYKLHLIEWRPHATMPIAMDVVGVISSM
jgi:hypothetical protein